MKNITLVLVFFCSISLLPAQGVIKFEEETHDFGDIEEGTVATYEFEFTNEGNQPIELQEVKASCGCTTPFWTKEIIAPGKTGKIKASYNSKGRPGAFTKSITVRSNAQQGLKVLYIKGFVKPSNTSAEEKAGKKYNASLQSLAKTQTPPSIRIEADQYDFGKIETGSKIKKRFKIYNTGHKNLVITALNNECKCITFGLSNGVVEYNQYVTLELTLNADQIRKLDEDFTIYTNDPQNPVQKIRLKAEVFENFSKHMFKSSRALSNR